MEQHKIFLFGLDYAGKTTIASFLKDGSILNDPVPTTRFTIDSLIINQIKYLIWDAPGQLKYRDRWQKGVLDANILVFILDTADEDRYDEAKRELLKVLHEYDTIGVPLVFCFHKMDLDKAKENFNKAVEYFDLNNIPEHKVYSIETSIKLTDQMEFLKNLLGEMIEIKDWESDE